MNINLWSFVFINICFRMLPKINKQTQTNTSKFISLTKEHKHKIPFGKCS
ncbi:hypothetical protein Hanom_Chr06g00492331 [Helianthus anomalus]